MKQNKALRLLGLAKKAGKVSFGTESSIETIKMKKAKLVIVAEDASQRTKRNFQMICERENVEIRFFGTIESISQSIGQVNKAVIVIKDKNFSNEIVKIIDGGEIIG